MSRFSVRLQPDTPPSRSTFHWSRRMQPFTKSWLFTMLIAGVLGLLATAPVAAEMKTWDGRHSIAVIDATIVYFLSADREALPDWRERIDHYADRLRQFHEREFQGQSQLNIRVVPEPLVSGLTTAQLRAGNADNIFFRTLREADRRLEFGRGESGGFPILIVMSDLNWRPLDDFSRLAPTTTGWRFEGSLAESVHVPGAASGGARATYLAEQGKGWGLVSGDGWRVPYRGSDCVVYHEGLGHTIGLPHPEPGDDSVMGFGQYQLPLNRSYITESQKRKLGWEPDPTLSRSPQQRLFDSAWAAPEPPAPRPGQPVSLKLDLPADLSLAQPVVELQTSLRGPWTRVSVSDAALAQRLLPIGSFDRPAAVSYRVTVSPLDQPSGIESPPIRLWGYFQVRLDPETTAPAGDVHPTDQVVFAEVGDVVIEEAIDLLRVIDPSRDAVSGQWSLAAANEEQPAALLSPKAFGARIEIPQPVPQEYQLIVIAEPLDEPNGLILGQISGGRRFAVLLGYAPDGKQVSAIENIDSSNVQTNETRVEGQLFRKRQPSQIIITVQASGVSATVDGRKLIDWRGDPSRLSLSDYWQTRRQDVLFLGCYDCRYRVTRITLQPLTPPDTNR
jgi:hypothetical protein